MIHFSFLFLKNIFFMKKKNEKKNGESELYRLLLVGKKSGQKRMHLMSCASSIYINYNITLSLRILFSLLTLHVFVCSVYCLFIYINYAWLFVFTRSSNLSVQFFVLFYLSCVNRSN